MSDPRVAGLLLTGGASRRLGRDKALLPAPGGVSLAEHLAILLTGVVEMAIEVGPGHSGLPSVRESPPGGGPLAAVLAGWHFLSHAGVQAVLVLAVDQPYVTAELLRFLADHTEPGSIVPLDDSRRPQPLCARYASTDLEAASLGFASGQRSMADLIAAARALEPDAWRDATEADNPFADLDTPEDLDAYLASLDGEP